MKTFVLSARSFFTLLFMYAGWASATPFPELELPPDRAAKCRARAVDPCFTVHGSYYGYYNGGCPLKIQVAGSGHRICIDDSPDGCAKYVDSEKKILWGDFEICPLQHEKPKEQGRACVLGVKNPKPGKFGRP